MALVNAKVIPEKGFEKLMDAEEPRNVAEPGNGVGGAGYFNEGAVVVAHRQEVERLGESYVAYNVFEYRQ